LVDIIAVSGDFGIVEVESDVGYIFDRLLATAATIE
jgi:hypothetical protein